MNLFADDGRDFTRLRREFRHTIPPRYNIGVDVCDRHLVHHDRVALYFENAAGDHSRYTFGQLAELSNRFANALRALGVERGDRVGIVLPQRAEAAIAHIAIYKLGAVALPLAVLFGRDALEYRLADSGARAVVTDAARAPLLESLRDALPALTSVVVCDHDGPGDERFWQLVEQGSPGFEVVDTAADDPALLIYTSGTTGPPKGALNAHRCLLGNLPGFELSHNFFPRPGDLFWTPADWAWTGGLLDGLLPALRYGVPVVGYEGGRFDPEHAFALMAKFGVRNSFIPPTAIKMLMQVPNLERFDLKLRSIMSAGEQVGVEVLRWSNEVLGVKLNEMWGQTEFNYLVGNCAAIMAPKPGSMGRPYPGHDVEPIDDDGQPMATGEVGELAARIGDPVMFIGYWGKDEATRAKITGDWFRTGDVGYRDEDGYLWFMGRKDDVISSAGHRIGPGEIEDCLLGHQAVAEAAVIGAPDELRGEIIKAFIVLAEGCEGSPDLVAELQQWVRERRAAYEYPRAVEFIGELPMTTTGKIRRIELRERERGAG